MACVINGQWESCVTTAIVVFALLDDLTNARMEAMQVSSPPPVACPLKVCALMRLFTSCYTVTFFILPFTHFQGPELRTNWIDGFSHFLPLNTFHFVDCTAAETVKANSSHPLSLSNTYFNFTLDEIVFFFLLSFLQPCLQKEWTAIRRSNKGYVNLHV